VLRTSGFMDDVIFAYKPRLLDVAAQLEQSAHAVLVLAIVRRFVIVLGVETIRSYSSRGRVHRQVADICK